MHETMGSIMFEQKKSTKQKSNQQQTEQQINEQMGNIVLNRRNKQRKTYVHEEQ